jgi:hypothetical protein
MDDKHSYEFSVLVFNLLGPNVYSSLFLTLSFSWIYLEQAGPDYHEITQWSGTVIWALLAVIGGLFYKKLLEVEKTAKGRTSDIEENTRSKAVILEQAVNSRYDSIEREIKELTAAMTMLVTAIEEDRDQRVYAAYLIMKAQKTGDASHLNPEEYLLKNRSRRR